MSEGPQNMRVIVAKAASNLILVLISLKKTAKTAFQLATDERTHFVVIVDQNESLFHSRRGE